MSDGYSVTQDGAIARLTFERPEKGNLLTLSMLTHIANDIRDAASTGVTRFITKKPSAVFRRSLSSTRNAPWAIGVSPMTLARTTTSRGQKCRPAGDRSLSDVVTRTHNGRWNSRARAIAPT